MHIEDLIGERIRSVLIFGVGGGGDIATAGILAEYFKRHGVTVYIGSIVWERFVIDPVPGPIPFNNLYNVKRFSDYVVIANENTYALRNNRKIVPQPAAISRVLGKEIILIDLWRGTTGLWKGLVEVADYYGIESFIAVDVGGDILARGGEDNLWSPLADSIGLAAFSKLKHSIIAVHGLGADGELDQEYLLSRIASIASKGGYLGAKGITKNEYIVGKKILKNVYSEASKIPLLAYEGVYGEVPIRMNTRKVRISPLQTITFFLDSITTYAESPIAKIVDNTHTLDEAREKLNNNGIYTEYDLEIDLYKYIYNNNIDLTPDIILKIRKRGINKLKKKRQN